MILEFEGKRPVIGSGVFIAPTAIIIGQVVIGDGSSTWFGAVLRGDEGQISIGSDTNVQDNVVIHTTLKHPTTIGDRVTIGHGALLEACTVESGAIIGMGAVVLEQAKVGAEALVAAGRVVTPGTKISSMWIAAGIPAKHKKEISGDALQSLKANYMTYKKLVRRYRKALSIIYP